MKPTQNLNTISPAEASVTFQVKDCALIAKATGKRARTLKDLRDILETIGPESLFYHFWGSLLRPRFEDQEYHNDFASWSAHSLNDKPVAERLGIVDPLEFDNLDELRVELMDIIDERIDELEMLPTASRDRQFEFISSDIVVFATHRTIKDPQDLKTVIPELSLGSIFYHFIDGRRRSDAAIDDFSAWLATFKNKYQDVIKGIAEIDPYFSSLTKFREALTKEFVKMRPSTV